MRLKTTLVALILIAGFGNVLFAQTGNAWTLIPNSTINSESFEKHYKPAVFKAFQLDEQAIRNAIASAPLETKENILLSPITISIPNAAGVLERFRVVESPVMEQGLADAYPMIKTYLGVNLDHPGSTARFDLTPSGFNAMVLSSDRKTSYVNVVDRGNGYYVVFDRNGMAKISDPFVCNTVAEGSKAAFENPAANSADDGTRRTFKLCVTVNGEFSQACLDGTETTDAQRKAKVLAVLTTDLNRANGIYDRDFGVRMNYISGMDAVLYLIASSDPFAVSTSGWNTSCRTTLTNVIGGANFDIGHLIGLTTVGNENGNAGCIGCVCANGNSNSTFKGSGFTAFTEVQGDPLVVDYWTHEMGHQFGANHTFTFQTEGTGANMEPGSGSTIMGYAGITGATDVQLHSDDYFHAKSIDQVTTYIKSASASCAVSSATGNSTPTANAGPNYTIPKSTPFMLTGSGSDANAGDVLTYVWEQYDNYTTGSNTYPAATLTTGPVFKSMPYSTSSTRVFPEINSILNGTNSNLWEVLPSVARTMNFRMTVRDNSALGGANNYSNMAVTVDATTGPFQVTSPNNAISWIAGDFQTVTWNVAGTASGAVNCANVSIELSIDGGNTFPFVLAASTPNDGSQEITVPNNITNIARVRVRGVGNIFFDISNNNFSIQSSPTATFAFNTPDAVGVCSGNAISTSLNTASLGSYSTPITLSATGNPPGSAVIFSPSSVTPGNTVTVSLTGTVPAGLYTVTVTGTSGSIVKTRNLVFNVIGVSSSPSLSTPVNGVTTQAITPTLSWTAFPGATSYTVDVATNSSFATIVATKTGLTATNYTLTTALNQNTLYYWRVTAISSCSNNASSTYSFTTSGVTCGTFNSFDIPVSISSFGTPTITSSMYVSNVGNATSVKVLGLQATHSYISDLAISLTNPSGTTIALFQNSCSSAAYADMNINFDDAASSATIPCPPTGGITRRPKQALSAFTNQSITGSWTLTVADGYDQDGGSLDAWALNFCITGGVLPVSWLDFTGRRTGERNVQLNWSTASESNNKEFQVERSKDGISFDRLGTIEAGNNPTGIQQYLFNDMKPYTGANYYRLKQVDNDGKYKYSTIVKVIIDQDRNLYSLSPNPATTKTVLNVYKEMKQVNVKLIDVSGKIVYSISNPVMKAGETLNLTTTGLAKGYYLVIIESEAGRFTEKLIVQ